MTSAKLVTQAEQCAATRSAVYLQNPRHWLKSTYKCFRWFDIYKRQYDQYRLVDVRVLGQWDLRVTAKPVKKVHVPR